MDFQRQAEAYSFIETLLNNGCTMDTLPINKERAGAIIAMREPATEADLQALKLAVSDNHDPPNPNLEA
jgi:hypothetical protein